MRRRSYNNKKNVIVKFDVAGTYTFTVPANVTSVDVFLVGAGSGGALGGGGGGYTKCYKADNLGYKDGNAIPVSPGESITIIVGAGGSAGGTVHYYPATSGGYSQFKSSAYQAQGGYAPASTYYARGGNGGSGGSGYIASGGSAGGSDGSNGNAGQGSYVAGTGQGHTTREWGLTNGLIYASGGYGGHNLDTNPSTDNLGIDGLKSGDGGAAGADGGYIDSGNGMYGGKGHDGLIIIRYTI